MTGNSVLLDSSVIVQHFRGVALWTEALGRFEELYISHVALGELYFGASRSQRPSDNFKIIERFLDAVSVLGIDLETARTYGRIAAQLADHGTPIPQNDIWIAAVAIQCQLPLVTLDSHFQKVHGLTVVSSPGTS